MEVMDKEFAEQELKRIIAYFGNEEISLDTRQKLLSGLQSGKVMFDESKSAVSVNLSKPIQLETGGEIKSLVFEEPTVDDLKVLDKYGDKEKMGKTIHLISRMTGQPMGVVGRIRSRDLQLIGAITELFF